MHDFSLSKRGFINSVMWDKEPSSQPRIIILCVVAKWNRKMKYICSWGICGCWKLNEMYNIMLVESVHVCSHKNIFALVWSYRISVYVDGFSVQRSDGPRTDGSWQCDKEHYSTEFTQYVMCVDMKWEWNNLWWSLSLDEKRNGIKNALACRISSRLLT